LLCFNGQRVLLFQALPQASIVSSIAAENIRMISQ
jgi:hypothetical protein